MSCDGKSCGFYCKMNRSVSAGHAFPIDMALKVVSSLQVFDVCSLGCCSQYWHEVCGSDFVWESLSRKRWPNADLNKEFAAYQSQDHELDQPVDSNSTKVKKHKEMAEEVDLIATFVERKSSLESIDVRHFQKAIEDMHSVHFSFEDVKLLLFKPNLSVLLNLVGLHYSTMQLDVPVACSLDVIEVDHNHAYFLKLRHTRMCFTSFVFVINEDLEWQKGFCILLYMAEYAMEALIECKIEERSINVQWKRLRRRLGIFCLQDSLNCANVSLGELATDKGGVLFLIQRGVFNEWLRIQISAA